MKNKWKLTIAFIVALMAVAPTGAMAEDVTEEKDIPSIEISVEKAEESASEEESEEISDEGEKPEKEKKKEQKEKRKAPDETEQERVEEEEKHPEKPHLKEEKKGYEKQKFDRTALEAKKRERKENRLEAKEFFKELKEAFSEANVETKRAILAEIASVKKELKDDSIGMFVKGKPVDFEKYDGVGPEIRQDRTLIPLRAAVEILEADVLWSAKERTVTIMKDETEIVLQIDHPIAFVNGVETELDCAPVIHKDRTMVPVRFLAETLNLSVSWDEESRIVIAE